MPALTLSSVPCSSPSHTERLACRSHFRTAEPSEPTHCRLSHCQVPIAHPQDTACTTMHRPLHQSRIQVAATARRSCFVLVLPPPKGARTVDRMFLMSLECKTSTSLLRSSTEAMALRGLSRPEWM